MTDDDRQPFPSEWTDIAERPTPYDDYTAAMETGRMAGGMRRLRSRSPKFARLLVALAVVCIAFIVAAVAMDPPWNGAPASGQAASTDLACQDQDFKVPTPQLIVENRRTDMDLLWAEHSGCGHNADGGANLGVPVVVVSVDESLMVQVPDRFDARHTVTSTDEGEASGEVRFTGKVSVRVPGSGCHRFEVELEDGDLRGRFAALLETAGEACTPR